MLHTTPRSDPPEAPTGVTDILAALANALREASDGSLLVDIADQASLKGGALCLSCDDVEFFLVPTDNGVAEATAYCIYGQCPAAQEPAVWRRLLELNLATARAGHAGFGVDGQTGEVVHAFTVRLDPSRAALLLGVIEGVARHARAWRRDFGLVAQPASPAAVRLMQDALLV